LSVELCFLPATELVARYRARTLSPVEVARAVLDRIHALNPKLNAFCLVDAEGALAAARAASVEAALEARGITATSGIGDAAVSRALAAQGPARVRAADILAFETP